ncbi:MAG: 50S ribosomal protein L30e [Candidatus Aenigmarchaeota archaeon]|nr:50S ribosomal protein L30e [Candidatus Aenigmarchaeota archaeon]
MLSEEIQTALKTDNAILGYRRSIRFIKLNQAKLIVMASNAPDKIKNEIEHISKLSNSKFELFSGNSKDLGILCGRPFPVSVLTIKG